MTDIPAKVYWTTVPRTAFAEFGRVMKELGVEWAEPDAADGPGPQLGLPDDEITTWVDTSSYGAQKFDALAAHASQTENIFFLRTGPGAVHRADGRGDLRPGPRHHRRAAARGRPVRRPALTARAGVAGVFRP